MQTAQHAVTTIDGLQRLLDELRRRGYRVVGPTLRDQAIVYDDIASIDDLPRGWTDEQNGGRSWTCPTTSSAIAATRRCAITTPVSPAPRISCGSIWTGGER